MGNLFSSPKPPKALDPKEVAGAQTTQNNKNIRTQVVNNRISQRDQYGNRINYTRVGTDKDGNPKYRQDTKLGGLGKDAVAGLGALGKTYLNSAQGLINNRPDLNSQAAFDQAYGYATANLEPRFQRAEAASENRLRNQGLDPTSEAYKSQMNDLALQQNEARNSLVTGLQNQMFNQGLAGRNQQVNELMSLSSPGIEQLKGAANPNFQPVPQVNVPNVDMTQLYALQHQGLMNQYNAQVQQQGGLLGGLAGIGGSILSAPMTGGASVGGMLAGKLFG